MDEQIDKYEFTATLPFAGGPKKFLNKFVNSENPVKPVYHISTNLIISTLQQAFSISSIIRQKSKFQNGCFKKTKHGKFTKNKPFLSLISTRNSIRKVQTIGYVSYDFN